MKTRFLLATIVPALALSACGGKGGGNAATPGAEPGKTVAAVAAPTGARWSETVMATPAGGFMMGNPNAAIKLIEYGSYTCPHCRDFAKEADEPLAKEYVDTGKVSFEFRSFIRDPLDLTAAVVARCAGKDPFFAMTQALYANQEAMVTRVQAAGEAGFQSAMTLPPAQRFNKVADLAGLTDFAKQHGVPETQVRACLADSKAAEAIAKGNDVATSQFNVQGTPTIIMNGTPLENVATWPQLRQKLRDAGA